MLLIARDTPDSARAFIEAHAEIFAVFDASTQDSGNISYGVRHEGKRYFVKTAGVPDDPTPLLRHPERVALLRNAVDIARAVAHPTLPALRNVIEAADGPMLVYEWVDGELLNTDAALRENPTSAFARFRTLPATRRIDAVGAILDLHVAVVAAGWLAADFYDGCLIYDFERYALHIVDLDTYHRGPTENRMGRMFGSSRFMAPEELTLGARIDERTTVFNLGRTIQQLVFDADPGAAPLLDLAAAACRTDPSRRTQSVAELQRAWHDSFKGISSP